MADERAEAATWTERAARASLCLLGLGSIGVGAVAVFVSTNGAGTASLVVTGGVLSALGLLWDRVESFRFGENEIRLRSAAALLVRSEIAEQRGDEAASEQLRAAAFDVLTEARPIGARYEEIRRTAPASRHRTKLMAEQLARARALAAVKPPTREEVDALFHLGSDGDRITALAFVQAVPEAGDVALVTGAIAASRSAYEQWQALRAAQGMVAVLGDSGLRQLEEGLRRAQSSSPYLQGNSDRSRLLAEVLAAIQRRARAEGRTGLDT